MYHCLSFAIGSDLEVKFRLCIDNAAARAFFCRSGMGHIRHICLRILWVQSEVKERTILRIGQVTRDNPLDIGTKRLTSLKVTCQILLAFLTICLLARALHSHSGINWRCQFGLFLSLGRLARSWPFGDATSAASTTASALWLSVETRSQSVHTSWSFPTRLKMLDAYLVAQRLGPT